MNPLVNIQSSRQAPPITIISTTLPYGYTCYYYWQSITEDLLFLANMIIVEIKSHS
jgi:hypothetical protein